MKIAIFGVNGFIGSHLLENILANTTWEVFGFDRAHHQLKHVMAHPHFHFQEADILLHTAEVEYLVKKCDVILPLAAIATPATYVQQPLKIFELDFEANLNIIRHCVKYQKRLIFPSTSEVYGMCTDAAFSEEESHLVTGPIHKQRWIYSSCKQLLDRLIYAYGQQDHLHYTLFRPFNWVGPRLDDIHNQKPGGSRVVTQFLGNIFRGEPLQLVDDGMQQRCLTDIDDGINALIKIIENKNEVANQQIFNIGNPRNNINIRSIAEKLLALCQDETAFKTGAKQTKIMSTPALEYYGSGYQDVGMRVPDIEKAKTILGWHPVIETDQILEKTVRYYAEELSR